MAYLLGYVCGDEFTTLGYLVKTRELVRVRINLDGHVTGELWQEHAVDRLKNAANGGSLDDTPKGKRPGGFVSLRANPEGRAK
ncbi:hypothetical protein E8L03_11075 [Oceanidesulfovibrio marinus]|nr:hypothetical protein E8L03_11075 [Oceanidesulfovibrio marinus]